MSKSEQSKVKTYKGSCHCGAVRFEAELDLGPGNVTRCNCSVCSKVGGSNARTDPRTFKVVAGAEHLSQYRVGASVNYRAFCKHCGVQCYGAGNVPEIGGEFCSVNVNCLDGVELSALEIGYWDGRHDNWQAGMRKEPWPILTAAS